MMKEEHKCCLKELIPKMGPRLRAIDVIEKEYGKKTVKHGPSRDSNKVENIAFKGQMKIQMEGGEWGLEKLDEKVFQKRINDFNKWSLIEHTSQLHGQGAIANFI